MFIGLAGANDEWLGCGREFSMIRPAHQNLVRENSTIRDALRVLEDAQVKLLIVVDENDKFVGTCTDGDIRRAILRSGSARTNVNEAVNRSPVTFEPNFNPGWVKTFLRKHNVHFVPIVDRDRLVHGIVSAEDHLPTVDLNVPVVLMAGGLGSRLLPLTSNCPKPLLPIGDRPILQHIMERFLEQGFSRFFISINYLGHMSEEYFGSGKQIGAEISYLRENRRLGTGGALDLLPTNMDEPFIVMNGDLITEMDFRALVSHHRQSESVATICVREHLTSFPFGVVDFDGSVYLGVDEKPTLKHHINAGIYCLSHAAREVVPHDEFYDMPALFEDLRERVRNCAVHVMHDSWIDIGTPDQYRSAQKRFQTDALEPAARKLISVVQS